MYSFDDIYDTLIGQASPTRRVPGVPDAFSPGSVCSQKNDDICDACHMLYRRLGRLDDEDIAGLLNAVEDVQKELCRYMFLLGMSCRIEYTISDVPPGG